MMNKWTPEQRNRLILVCIGTAGGVAMIWLTLVTMLDTALQAKADQITLAENDLVRIREGIAKEAQLTEEAENLQTELRAEESRMASGDTLLWVINNLSGVASRHGVTITGRESPKQADPGIRPEVPYPTLDYAIIGSGYYHSIGTFLADLENSFPFVRTHRLTLQAVGSGVSADVALERLTFRLEFYSLAVPSATR